METIAVCAVSFPGEDFGNDISAGTTFDFATAAAKKYGLPILIGIAVGKFVPVISRGYLH